MTHTQQQKKTMTTTTTTAIIAIALMCILSADASTDPKYPFNACYIDSRFTWMIPYWAIRPQYGYSENNPYPTPGGYIGPNPFSKRDETIKYWAFGIDGRTAIDRSIPFDRYAVTCSSLSGIVFQTTYVPPVLNGGVQDRSLNYSATSMTYDWDRQVAEMMITSYGSASPGSTPSPLNKTIRVIFGCGLPNIYAQLPNISPEIQSYTEWAGILSNDTLVMSGTGGCRPTTVLCDTDDGYVLSTLPPAQCDVRLMVDGADSGAVQVKVNWCTIQEYSYKNGMYSAKPYVSIDPVIGSNDSFTDWRSPWLCYEATDRGRGFSAGSAITGSIFNVTLECDLVGPTDMPYTCPTAIHAVTTTVNRTYSMTVKSFNACPPRTPACHPRSDITFVGAPPMTCSMLKVVNGLPTTKNDVTFNWCSNSAAFVSESTKQGTILNSFDGWGSGMLYDPNTQEASYTVRVGKVPSFHPAGTLASIVIECDRSLPLDSIQCPVQYSQIQDSSSSNTTSFRFKSRKACLSCAPFPGVDFESIPDITCPHVAQMLNGQPNGTQTFHIRLCHQGIGTSICPRSYVAEESDGRCTRASPYWNSGLTYDADIQMASYTVRSGPMITLPADHSSIYVLYPYASTTVVKTLKCLLRHI